MYDEHRIKKTFILSKTSDLCLHKIRDVTSVVLLTSCDVIGSGWME